MVYLNSTLNFQQKNNMETEYNTIYFQIKRRPSPKCIMVSIPLYMYRIETSEFNYGLNFFQKIILKFKAKPGIKDEIIAEYTGLDPKLIAIITAELQSMQLINEHGSLSEKGKEKLRDCDGLVVNSGKKKIGYAFKYINQDKLYQYYVNKVVPADLLDNTKGQFPKIITGTKGDGEDYTEVPFFLDEAKKNKSNYNRPTERELLQLIQNSNIKGFNSDDDESKNEKLSNQLSIRFINDQPELIWACTYIYLHQNEDDTYEPDWRVLDPFGFGENISLKFYINNPANKNLLESIKKRFSDAKTAGEKLFADQQEYINKLIEDKLLSDFAFGFNHLEKNLQLYIEAIIKSYILLEYQNYNDLDASVSLSLNIQNALENILKQDKVNRLKFYELVYNNLDGDSQTKRNSLISIYRQRLLSNYTFVPQSLLSICKGKLSRGTSLLSHLVSFILTYNYDNKSVLFKILKDKVELFIELSQLRNEKGHGKTENEKKLKSLSKDQAEKYYNFIKLIVNDYIQKG